MNSYTAGTRVTISGVFQHDGVDTDPAIVRAVYSRIGSGVETTLTYADDEITKTATGHYSFDVLLSAAGIWSYRMDDGGTNIAEGGYMICSRV